MSRADEKRAFVHARGATSRTGVARWIALQGATAGSVQYNPLTRQWRRSLKLPGAAVVALSYEALARILPTNAPLDTVVEIALPSLTKKPDFECDPIDFLRSGYEDSPAFRLQQKAEARAVNKRAFDKAWGGQSSVPHRRG